MASSNEFNEFKNYLPLPAIDKIWDVAIVGAGPAGSTAAIHLAAKGHRVLLLDKDDFPRDKVCGDGLIADSIGALKRAGLFEAVYDQSFEANLGTVYSPSRVAFDVPGQFLTLKRIQLDDLILKRAITSGALFRQCKVAGIQKKAGETIRLALADSEEVIEARVVFLATGANVELPAALGLVESTTPSAVALRCYVRSSFSLDRLIISYDRSITPGYAWIFPLRNGEYNIGCGVTYRGKRNAGVNLRDYFQYFVKSFPIAKDLMKKAEAISPIKGAQLRCGLRGTTPKGKGNILVLGESLGATFPFTGEGIGKAMETGELAASIADKALSTADMDELNTFPARLETEIRHKYLGYKIAEDWFSSPWLTDFVARRIQRSRYLRDALAGIVNETVDPRVVFSVKGILRSFFR